MHEASTAVFMNAAQQGLASPVPPTVSSASRWSPWRLMPMLGPLVLFIIWDLVVRFKLIPPILLPSPWTTLSTLFVGMAGGSLSGDFAYTLIRTLEAFLIAAVVGVPVGVLLGSNERAYRSVEFVIDFFRSTPSSALIPLFLMIFGVSDINKVAIAAFGALLIVLFNSAYGVINARKQRVMAAKVMGATRWQIFKDVLIWESLQPTFVGLRSAVSMSNRPPGRCLKSRALLAGAWRAMRSRMSATSRTRVATSAHVVDGARPYHDGAGSGAATVAARCVPSARSRRSAWTSDGTQNRPCSCIRQNGALFQTAVILSAQGGHALVPSATRKSPPCAPHACSGAARRLAPPPCVAPLTGQSGPTM